MQSLVTASDRVHWLMSELTSRIVAATGIHSDRYHLGKVILQSLKDAPDCILQIDAATGKSENFKSALERSVHCALSLKKMGFKCGDVMAIIAPQYLEWTILYYSALYLGIIITVMDPSSELFKIKEMLQVSRANIIFTLNDKIPVVKEAIEEIDLKAKIVSFDEGNDVMSFAKLIEECSDVDVDAFRPTDFDPDVTMATLWRTSGTTGQPKLVPITHKNYLTSSVPSFCMFPTPYNTFFIPSTIQWISAMILHLSAPILKITIIQTSAGISAEHYIDVINKYRPQVTFSSPFIMFSIIDPRLKKKVDLTCFRTISMGGSVVPQQLFNEIKKITPNTLLLHSYGASEVSSIIFRQPPSLGSLGRPFSCYNVRLVDPETLKDITEPHVSGELCVTGPSVVKGYYKNPIATKAAFLDDGWYRTGDIFYRDEDYFFYFVDRLKLLFKYKTYHVSPAELEKVIRDHPGVLDVVVVGIPDLECGNLPAACIVPHPDNPSTAQEINNLVKEKLSDAKQLRGGVIFMDEFPLTVTTKVDRNKLKAMAATANKE